MEFLEKYGDNVNSTKISFGNEGLTDISSNKVVDIVVIAIVGFTCLNSVIDAINNDKTIIIANKEILVSAGEMIMKILEKI